MPLNFALLLEKVGRVDEALVWAERVATIVDPLQGASLSPIVPARGLLIKGRCLASKGQADEAEEALSSAAKKFDGSGWFLGEVLALRDLLVCVLRPAGREGEGIGRLKESIVRLLGAEPTEEDLDVLDRSLGDDVDVATVMSA